LHGHFGTALQSVYDDMPLNTPTYERNRGALSASLDIAESATFAGIDCIHGHFLPLKYLLLSVRTDIEFITWLREPVERLLSHYYYWQRVYDPLTAPSLHRRVVEEEWSLERFCLSPELRNLYGQFFWGFPLENFDFIGITEFFEEDLRYFSRTYLNTTLEAHSENVGEKQGGKYLVEEGLRARIEEYHTHDVALYARAMALRQRRVSACKGNDHAHVGTY